MQLSDNGGALTTRPAPNVTTAPGYLNNDRTQTTAPTISDPDMGNAILAELMNLATTTGQTANKANVIQALVSVLALASANYTDVVAGSGGTSVTLTPANAGLIVVDATLGNVTFTTCAAAAAAGTTQTAAGSSATNATITPLDFTFLRIDSSAHTVSINKPGSGAGSSDTVVGGSFPIAQVTALPLLILRNDGVSKWFWSASALGNGVTLAPGQCQLQYASATALHLAPVGGSGVVIAGVLYSLPSGGVNAANTNVYVNGTAAQNLAASTLYYVYLFNNSGTLTIDFSATSHATDTTAGNVGVEIKNGDNTRSLVGLIYTNGSAQFADSGANRLVASWFNPQTKTGIGQFSTVPSTSSTSFVELQTSIRVTFVTFGNREVSFSVSGENGATVSGLGVQTAMSFDGSLYQESCFVYVASSSIGASGSFSGRRLLSEGYHYATLLGGVNTTGTGSWANAYPPTPTTATGWQLDASISG
jgi:hypothetical protein